MNVKFKVFNVNTTQKVIFTTSLTNEIADSDYVSSTVKFKEFFWTHKGSGEVPQ